MGEEIPALHDVSLSIRAGEWVAVLGANGSGKSTLAKHLNALLLPDRGQVTVEGMDTADNRHLYDIRRLVGMVFQNPDNQLVATTIEEDVAFGPENLGLPPEQIQQRITEALKAVGLEQMGMRPPHSLSGGQKQRLAVAGVLALGPKYLVLDEATAMLDPAGRQEVMNTVRHLHNTMGMTVISITHSMDEALHANRIIIMSQGRILIEGSPESVFQQESLLAGADLEVPVIAKIAQQLREKGVLLEQNVLTLEELVSALCRLRSVS